MNKTLVFVLVGVVVLAGGYFLFANKGTAPETEVPTGEENSGTEIPPLVGETPTETTGVKEFAVEGGNFSFSLKEMKVKKGDTVKVTFKNVEGSHDWILDEFAGAKTKILKAGESETVEFVADKTGTFEYYCSVGQHRQMGMVGKLIVE